MRMCSRVRAPLLPGAKATPARAGKVVHWHFGTALHASQPYFASEYRKPRDCLEIVSRGCPGQPWDTPFECAMDPVAQGPFSTSSEAPATILVSSPVVVLSLELPHQRDLTKADPSISWSSCTHAAAATQ